MSKFLRKPESILWVLSISQAIAMLAFNVMDSINDSRAWKWFVGRRP